MEKNSLKLSRRHLLAGTGALAGSLLIGWRPAGAADLAAPTETDLAGWLRINSDNTVTVYCAQAEMGQGVMTALAALVAEELEVDWASVRVEMPDSEERFRTKRGRRFTGNSDSVMSSFDPLRSAGAAAREMLLTAAAAEWQVEAAECSAAAGKIVHAASGRSLSYAELASRAATLSVPESPPLKTRADWKLIGKPLPRKDVADKVYGRAIYGADVRLPGMQTATIMASPRFGGKLKAVDPAPALAREGVSRVVELPDAVAVVADGYWNALQGLRALKPEWDETEAYAGDSAAIRASNINALGGEAAVGKAQGDTAAAIAAAAQVVEADYDVPYLAHLCMEPMNATVHFQGTKAEVWAPTQTETDTARVVAGALGIDADDVIVHTTMIGGGFGRRSYTDFALQAALIAKAVGGGPVKLIWSREEDLRHDRYRPAMAARYRGALDESGRLTALEVTAAGPSLIDDFKMPPKLDPIINVMGLSGDAYTIENQFLRYARNDHGVPLGIWRATLLSENGFFVESFVDELAAAAGRDRYEFRMELVGENAAAAQTLQQLQALFDFSPRKETGRGWGLALATGWNCVAAAAVDLTMVGTDTFRINDVACALHCGTVINPAIVESQVQGGFLYGLCAALWGDARIAQGAVVPGNFDTQPVLRMDQAPRVRMGIVPSDAAPGGVGEITTAVAAPALCNALAAAGGPRIRSLPVSAANLQLTA